MTCILVTGSAGAQDAVVVGWLSAKGVPKARFSADASVIRLLYAVILVLVVTQVSYTGCGVVLFYEIFRLVCLEGSPGKQRAVALHVRVRAR